MARNPLVEGATRREIAELLGVDERSITNYQKETPAIPHDREGRTVRYPVRACVAWKLEREIRGARENKLPSELEMARHRKVLADARIAEREADLAEGSVIPLELHEQRVTALAARLAATCTGGLGKYRGDVQRARTVLEADALLERIGDELLRACLVVGAQLETEATEHQAAEAMFAATADGSSDGDGHPPAA